MQLTILETMFKQCNMKVQTAKNGFEAFQKVQMVLNNENEAPFNLILLDLQMPISDGYDAMRNINLLYDEFKIFKIDQCYIGSSYS